MGKKNFLLKFWPDLPDDTSDFTLFISATCDGASVSTPELSISPQGETWVIVSDFSIDCKSGGQWIDFLEFRVSPYDENSVSFWVKNKNGEDLRIGIQEIKGEKVFKKSVWLFHALFLKG